MKTKTKKTSAKGTLKVGQTVSFRLAGRKVTGRVIGTLGRTQGKRKQLLRIELKSSGREDEPMRFSLPADLVSAQ
jgi:hypothetical protein